MINFDRDAVIRNFSALYSKRPEVEAIADDICDRGFRLLLFTSSGGSMAMMQPFSFWINRMSSIPVADMISADLLLTGYNQLDGDSVVFLTSKSGDTKETLDAARYAREKGARVISVVGAEHSPLEQLSHASIVYGNGRPQELIFYFLIGRILFRSGFFHQYPDFADNLACLGNALADVRIQSDEKCRQYALDFCREPYNIWIGSGDLWPAAYSYSMCVLEESQWIRTKSVSSPEFFHGTLELLEKDVCVTLLLTEGPTRPLDERVKEFARKHTDKLTCFDTRDYDLTGIKPEYRQYLSPVVMAAVLQRISKNIEVITGHSLDIRRYYRKGGY